jgi:hypothetical protein
MTKFFNASGPCNPEKHYMIDIYERLNKIQNLIDNERYLILHAPRQTGKTSSMTQIAKQLNSDGKYIAIYINVESAQAVRDNVEATNRIVISEFKTNIMVNLPETYYPSEQCYKPFTMMSGITHFLTSWCLELPKPLVVFIDEIDSLIGDSLLTVLRQLRAGYERRPKAFPHSLFLIGLRDIRDYRIYSDREKRYIIGGSCFNIKEKALTLANFSLNQIIELFKQHTDATGQKFETDALSHIYYLTQGQPWLVNAFGRELCFDDHAVEWNKSITKDDVEKIKDIIIQRRDVHLDQLADKLTDPKVSMIIQLIITGESADFNQNITNDDFQYVIDLGLIRIGNYGYEIANPIYREVIPGVLTKNLEQVLGQNPMWYINTNGKLNIEKLLNEFIRFYKEHSELVTKRKLYNEAAHHLLFMAWIQRIVNSGGRISREYAAGLKRLDMLVEFSGERFAFELKRESKNALKEGKKQLKEYLDRLSMDSGYLIIFNRTPPDNWDNVGIRDNIEFSGKKIAVLYI